MSDHIRRQIDPGYLMAFLCKKNGKKSGSAAYIQDPEILFLRQVLLAWISFIQRSAIAL